METATHSAFRRAELVTEVPAPGLAETPRVLTVTATYHLSEEGRKASLLVGGDGRAQQQITLQVPTTRLHLVTVDANGHAGLKLRPRYEIDGQQRVVRVDKPPTYDRPPTIDELFRDAARNHELERTFLAERGAARARRREADTDVRARLATVFLSDKTQRALVHPAPSPKRCYLNTDRGRILFDLGTDEGPAKEVPPEAHRRFRADLAARKERNRQLRAEQLALHEEKKHFIADWIAAHGTAEQQTRHAAGVLPMDEAIEAIADQVFAALGHHPRYQRDGAGQLQAYLQRLHQYRDVIVHPTELIVNGTDAATATAAQWNLVRELQGVFPGARITLRAHRLAWKRDPQARTLTQFGILLSQKCGPLVLRREYCAPQSNEQ